MLQNQPAIMTDLHESVIGIYVVTSMRREFNGNILFLHVEAHFDHNNPNVDPSWPEHEDYSIVSDYENVVSFVNRCWNADQEYSVLACGAGIEYVKPDTALNPAVASGLTISYAHMAWENSNIFKGRPRTLQLFRSLGFLFTHDPFRHFIFFEVTGTLNTCTDLVLLLSWLLVVAGGDLQRFIAAPCSAMISIFQNWSPGLQAEWPMRDDAKSEPFIPTGSTMCTAEDIRASRASVSDGGGAGLAEAIFQTPEELDEALADYQAPSKPVPLRLPLFVRLSYVRKQLPWKPTPRARTVRGMGTEIGYTNVRRLCMLILVHTMFGLSGWARMVSWMKPQNLLVCSPSCRKLPC